MRRAAWLCDFDGTISPTDIGAAFARRFSPGGAAESPEFLERWRRGEMGHRELTEAQCRLLSATAQEALEFARGFELDPAFAPFVRETQARGDAVEVASEGLDFYVRDRLEHAGLGDVPWSANRVRFEGRRVSPEFAPVGDGCGRCGNCKGMLARALKARGFEVILVGDGLSDRCGAREADQILARGGLLEWCREQALAATPFENFADVARFARDRAPRSARPASIG
jgi:2-hydroxy-3-keto-5-methylthiopentenyl-1-phosphate phosphatase